MKKWIVRSNRVRLFFVSGGFFKLTLRSHCTGELVVSQRNTWIALHGVAPRRDGFVLVAQLPKRFAFFLASENQILPLIQSRIETYLGLIVTT